MAAPKKIGISVEPKIYTALVLDFETGGLDPRDCACTQIAIQAVRMDTWEVLGSYQKYITPYNKQDIGGTPKRKVLKSRHAIQEETEGVLMKYEKEALAYTAITMETLNLLGEELKTVAVDVIEFAKAHTLSKGAQCKPILIGQNITFDVGFLQQMMAYAGLTKEFEKTIAGITDFYGNFQPHYIDTIDLGRMAFCNRADVTSYKLEILAERFGILLDDTHDAGADVTATLNIAAVCASRLRQEGSDGFVMAKQEKTRTHFKI